MRHACPIACDVANRGWRGGGRSVLCSWRGLGLRVRYEGGWLYLLGGDVGRRCPFEDFDGLAEKGCRDLWGGEEVEEG